MTPSRARRSGAGAGGGAGALGPAVRSREDELRGAEEGLEGVARLEAARERPDAGGDSEEPAAEGCAQDEEGQQLGGARPAQDHHGIGGRQEQPEDRGGPVEHDGDDLRRASAHLPLGDEVARLGQGAGQVHDGGGPEHPGLLARGDEGLGLGAHAGGAALGAGDVVGVALHDARHDHDEGEDRQEENERQAPLDAEEVDQDEERGGRRAHALGHGVGDDVVEGVHVVAHDPLDLLGASGREPAQGQPGELVHEPTAQGRGVGGVVDVESRQQDGGAGGGQAHDDAGRHRRAQEPARGRAGQQEARDVGQEDEGDHLEDGQEHLGDARGPHGPLGGSQNGDGGLRLDGGGRRRRDGRDGNGPPGATGRVPFRLLGPDGRLRGLAGGVELVELGQGARLAQGAAAHPVGLGVKGGLVQAVVAGQERPGATGCEGLRADPGEPAGPVAAVDGLGQALPVGKLFHPGRGDEAAAGQREGLVERRVALHVDRHRDVVGHGRRDRGDGRVGGEVPQKEVAGRGRIEQGEGLGAEALGDEPLTDLATAGPVGGRAHGMVEDEVDGEGAGLGIGVHQGVAALVKGGGVVRVGEPQADPGVGVEGAVAQEGVGAEGDADEVLRQVRPAGDDDGVLLGAEGAQHSPLDSLTHGGPFRSDAVR